MFLTFAGQRVLGHYINPFGKIAKCTTALFRFALRHHQRDQRVPILEPFLETILYAIIEDTTEIRSSLEGTMEHRRNESGNTGHMLGLMKDPPGQEKNQQKPVGARAQRARARTAF